MNVSLVTLDGSPDNSECKHLDELRSTQTVLIAR